MSQETSPVASLDSLVNEALERAVPAGKGSSPSLPAARPGTPTMGNLRKISYTHDAMIDLIVADPTLTQGQLAARFGYTQAWVSNIMASDAFQARLAERRKEVIDPTLMATVEERIRALTIRATEVLMDKLHQPQVSDTVALRAFELGAKGMGLGGNAPQKIVPVDLSHLAERLLAVKRQTLGEPIEGTATRVGG